jgi:GNAT superfamily N-acetyltransferase
MVEPDQAIIRDFQKSDLGPVRDLIRRTIDACYSGVYPPRAVRFFKDFHSEEQIQERHCRGDILVIERHGAVVATGTIVGGDIFGVFVDPKFQRHGYGAALMRALEDKARREGCQASKLNVSLPSRGFYESLGYEMLEKCSKDVGEGESLDYWKARKVLGRKDD